MTAAAHHIAQRTQERPVIAMLLFDGVEVLDFAGPYEVFAGARDELGEPYTRVFTVANRPEAKCHGGLRVTADATFDACPAFDMLTVAARQRTTNSVGQNI